MDTSYIDNEVDRQATLSLSNRYIACIKANFHGYISVSSRSSHSSQHSSRGEDVAKTDNFPDSELARPIESAAIEGKLSMSTIEDGKLSPSSHPIRKNISNSTGFLNEINDTQVQDGIDQDASQRSVNSSDIKSDCDFIVATAYFSKIKCVNSSIEYMKEITNTKIDELKPNSISVVQPPSSLSSEKKNVRQNPKGNSSDIKRLVSEVLSLLKKEPVMDCLQVSVPLRNKLSTTMTKGSSSSTNALFQKQSRLTSIKNDSTSPKQVSELSVFCFFYELWNISSF